MMDCRQTFVLLLLQRLLTTYNCQNHVKNAKNSAHVSRNVSDIRFERFKQIATSGYLIDSSNQIRYYYHPTRQDYGKIETSFGRFVCKAEMERNRLTPLKQHSPSNQTSTQTVTQGSPSWVIVYWKCATKERCARDGCSTSRSTSTTQTIGGTAAGIILILICCCCCLCYCNANEHNGLMGGAEQDCCSSCSLCEWMTETTAGGQSRQRTNNTSRHPAPPTMSPPPSYHPQPPQQHLQGPIYYTQPTSVNSSHLARYGSPDTKQTQGIDTTTPYPPTTANSNVATGGH